MGINPATTLLRNFIHRKAEMLDLNQRYRRNENFVYRKIEKETLLVPIKDNVGDMGCIYNLNEVGAFIWEHLDGSHSLETIKENILDEFDTSSEIAVEDLNDFLTQLKEIEAVYQVK
jgi:methyltransferase-like protein